MGNAPISTSGEALARLHALVSTSNRLLAPGRDEVLLATRRYNAMDARGVESSLAWRAIGIRLWAASHLTTGDKVKAIRARSRDARNRAEYLYRVALELGVAS